MLENKTASQVIKRYHRILMGDQNQIKVGTASTCTITVTNTAGAMVDVFVANIAPAENAAGLASVPTTGAEITAFVTAEGGGFYPVEFETYAITAVTGNAELYKGRVIYTGDCGITIGLA